MPASPHVCLAPAVRRRRDALLRVPLELQLALALDTYSGRRNCSQNSFWRQSYLTLVDKERSVAPTHSTFQSPVKVNRSRFGKVRNSDGKFLVYNLLCSKLPRMLGVLIFQPRQRRLRINISKKNPVVDTVNFHMQPRPCRIIAPGSQ